MISNIRQKPLKTDSQTNVTSYNKTAEQWAENRNKMPADKCVIDFISTLKPQGKVLDIGCGTGYPIAKYLSERGFKVTGIDAAEQMLNKAVSLDLKSAAFFLCDFFDFRPTEKYDGIIAFDTFFHFAQQKQHEIYGRLSGWMNKGAQLLFTHGHTHGEIIGQMFDEPFYYSSLSMQQVHKLLIDSGFEIMRSTENYSEATTGQRDLLIIARKV